MKKYLLMVIWLLGGCSNQIVDFSNLKPSTTVVSEDHIVGYIKEGDVTPTTEGIEIVIENESDETYYFGYDFSLEIEQNDKWYLVPFKEDVAFIEIGILLEPLQTYTEQIDLSSFGKLPVGSYRVIKTFYHEMKSVSVAIPFDIKK